MIKNLQENLYFEYEEWDWPRLNIAMPSPASDSIEMDFAIIAGISTFHLHGHQTSCKKWDNAAKSKKTQNLKLLHGIKIDEFSGIYRNETKDQVRPNKLE